MTTHASKTSTSFLESQFRTAIREARPRDLDALSSKLWAAHGAGTIADDQAQQLAELIQRRRSPVNRVLSQPDIASPRYYIQRSPQQRSPDRRASLTRRREHAATGPLPPGLAAGFTTGELAVLRVVADEWLAHGVCDRSLNELAARAGACRSLAQRTIRRAELDGLITVQRRPRSGRKHLTSIVRIVRAEWKDWLAKGRRKTYATNACNRAKPILAEVRQVQKSTPRSQFSRKAGNDRVDKTMKKEIFRDRPSPMEAERGLIP
jgi:DNA-binding MarR family transcriptional regulator